MRCLISVYGVVVGEIPSRKSANILDGDNGYGAYRRLSNQAVIVLDQESTSLIEAASSVITHVRANGASTVVEVSARELKEGGMSAYVPCRSQC